ncbi:hypothetical protein [Campylobacter canadensis]|uniref:Motility integral membrane protein n=1 Tax=Campylobacter canadensis TaxID=449520 RepID=A0ABS7WTE8_9BACT|nr:hypothetical protein [Campylobacter canadensis]MBZ7988053.1 hypothetical protein [Campylobacter canadensis]MBZ7995486.1 hypothetical protein [Campylobacter canadensis]MBZ7997296.1 hypothetical protein [Campylobacter canadensis]MBZ7999016.1 hypothetical protein [Campylobacter canadensis]MBZ8000824.1 hypothetical protein [Campylobacter canadensis]
MRADNFIYFFTVCGFFLGLIAAIVKFDDPFLMLATSIFTTFVFYVFIHIVIINYIDPNKLGVKNFNKKDFEENTNSLIVELENREGKIERLIKNVDYELAQIKLLNEENKARGQNAKTI